MVEISSSGSGEGPGEGNRPAYSTTAFYPAAATARLWPAGAGGRCSLAARAAAPARSKDWRSFARSGQAAQEALG
jgi:hypothetical protein